MQNWIRTTHCLALLTSLFCRALTEYPVCSDLHNEPELINGTQVRINYLQVNEEEDLQLQFETNLQTHYNILVYIDYLIDNCGPRTVCNKTCPDNGSICHCESKGHEAFLHYNPLALIVNLTLPYGVLQFVCSIQFLEYIVPGCVEGVKLVNATTNSATIMFSLSSKLQRLIGLMRHGPLRFLVELHKHVGIQEYLQLTMEATLELNSAIVNFEQLSPNINYTLFITSYAGDTIGCNKSFSFATNKSVPLLSPHLSSFDYSWSLNNLLVIWQPLSYETMGSDGVKYEIGISNSSSLIHHFNRSSNYFNVTLGELPQALSLRVWAFNHIGKAKQFTEIHIPLERETDDASTAIEFINKTHMYISMNIPWDAQLVSVRSIMDKARLDHTLCSGCVWTQREVVNITRQDGDFTRQDLDVTRLNGDVTRRDGDVTQNTDKHQVKLLFSFTKPETQLLQRKVTYQFYDENGNCISLSNLRAIVTQIIQDSQDNIIDVGQEEIMPTIKISSCLIFGQSTMAAIYPKIFISFKQNEVFQSMKEANCYYSRLSSSVKVKACFRDGCLQVHQDNDCSQAPQFLINSFEIIPSINGETCNGTNRYILNSTRETMLEQKCGLSSHWKFVCIKANGDMTSIISIPMPLEDSTNLSQRSTNNFSFFISVGCIVSLSFILLIIRCLCLCKKRKDTISQWLTFGNERLESLQLPKTNNNDQRNESCTASTQSTSLSTHLDDNSSGTTLVTYMSSNSSGGNSYTRIGC